MTRLLAFGDVHLDASPDFGAHPGDRLADQEATLQQIVELAVRENVAGVLFAGDAFHHRRPRPPVLMAWRTFTDTLEDAGIPLVGILGNHDRAALDEWTAPEVVARRGVFRSVDLTVLGDVAVCCLPWAPVSNLIAARNGGDREAIYEEAAALLVRMARGLKADAEHLNAKHSILLTHFSISGAVTPTGREVGPDFGVVLPCDELEALGFDFVVAGHIHKVQLLGREDAPGPIFYTGSPGVVDWGEAQTEHGAWIIDTAWTYSTATPTAYRFVPLQDRPFVTLDVDFAEGEDFSQILEGYAPAVAQVPDGAVMRVRYTATADQARRIDAAAVRAALHAAGAARVFIQPTIVREDRARVDGVDETLGPLEALDLYCLNNAVRIVGARAKAMAERTTRYLQEV